MYLGCAIVGLLADSEGRILFTGWTAENMLRTGWAPMHTVCTGWAAEHILSADLFL